jgi:hypothetical protein
MSEVKDDTPEAKLKKLIFFFENMKQENLAQLGHFYAKDAQFKDPFNDVVGVKRMEDIFLHMFHTLKDPKFVVHDAVANEKQAFLTWDFYFELEQMSSKGRLLIKGASHLIWSFDEEAKEWMITTHRDYWDAAEELYEKLPLIGGIMRWLKKKMATPL